MKRTNRIFLLFVVLMLILSACAPAVTATPTAAAVPAAKDANGDTITLEKPAERIISLAPSNSELLFAIGAGKQVIAREDFTNFPEEAKSLPSVGGNMSKYNLEQIASLQPDLILASPLTPPDQIKAMKDISAHVFVVANPTSFDELYTNIRAVGALTGHAAEASALTKDMSARVATVLEKVASAKDKPKVFYELDATDPAKPWTSGPSTFVDMLIGMAGGQNIGAKLTGEWAQISQEDLLVEDPNIILLGDSLYGGVTPEQVMARPGWAGLAAVKNNQVKIFNDDLVSRPGPRMVQGLEELAKLLHPDLFQ